MRAPSARFLVHTATVHAPASGRDADGAFDPTPGAAGTPLPCSCQETTTQGQATAYQPGAAPFGLSRHILCFAEDPGVSAAEQQLVVTADQDGPLATPIVLVSEGPAEPPQGSSRRWTVSATRRA